MSVLMHLSDLHFGAHDPRVCAAVARLVKTLDVSLLVVSGDLTQRATAEQFEQAHAFIAGLGVPHRLVMPGNHDVPLFAWWERLGRAYRRYERWWGRDLEPVCDVDGFLAVGVNTTRPWRHERGSLSHAQIDAVAQRLASAPRDRWRIVVTHHPLVVHPTSDTEHRPHRAGEALARWREAGAQLLLSGHAHEPGLAEVLPGLWAARAGTAVSVRLRAHAPNSLVTLECPAPVRSGAEVLPARHRLTRWDYDARLQAFLPLPPRDLGSAGT
ncbi:metallophosphoesterase [Acidovorax sp. SUPP950]|uniref:metallophosphoesterase family protein n=1 Tax=unclassified Acidovorax TaxID=2684926 RepID=UPI0023BDD069|nr:MULTISPECIES: metallophosphoesterase [Comamonadaceae]WOI44916.1 metallophosphoesterase [Paracidovorax avenae]GKS74416.1 metallophosphoesterase [Acidovorax sp. SUPP950]